MISPFLTTNIFLINLAVLLLTTSITGGIVSFVWMVIGRQLEKMGYVNIVFELMKLSAFFFICPVGYIFLKAFEMEVGRGYLFSPTGTILICVKIFLSVWGSGMVYMLLHTAKDVNELDKLYEDAFPCEKHVQCGYVRVAKQLGMMEHAGKRLPQLYQSYHTTIPFIKGIFRPMVILPVKEYTDEELQVIFTHELMHYKQGDVLLKRIMVVLLAIHFYNPLAWMLYKRVHTWSEYACDCRACEKAGGMKHYFDVILQISLEMHMNSRLSSQLVEDKHELVERVKRMKNIYGKKHSKWGAAMILSTAFMVSTLSVSAATLGTAELYGQWNKETVVEVENTTQMTEYEMFTEQGDAEGITVVQGEVAELARTSKDVDWEINNNIKMVGSYFSCDAGDCVNVFVVLSPDNATVKVGIESEDGTKLYVNGRKSVSYIFNIEEAGRYRFFIENTSGQTVTAKGSYTYI